MAESHGPIWEQTWHMVRHFPAPSWNAMDIDEHGRLVVVIQEKSEWNPRAHGAYIAFYDKEGEEVGTFGKYLLKNTNDLAVLPCGDIVTANGDKGVAVFTGNGELKLKITDKKQIGNADAVCSIQETKYAVCDDDQVKLFDVTSGKAETSFRFNCKCGFGNHRIASDHSGIIAISCQNGKALYLFDLDGQPLTEMKSGKDNVEFAGPKGMCFDTDKNLIVADSSSSTLIVVSRDQGPQFNLHQLVVNEGWKWSWDVLLSKQQLFVLDNNRERVLVFENK